jgi:hypothetical protein
MDGRGKRSKSAQPKTVAAAAPPKKKKKATLTLEHLSDRFDQIEGKLESVQSNLESVQIKLDAVLNEIRFGNVVAKLQSNSAAADQPADLDLSPLEIDECAKILKADPLFEDAQEILQESREWSDTDPQDVLELLVAKKVLEQSIVLRFFLIVAKKSLMCLLNSESRLKDSQLFKKRSRSIECSRSLIAMV